MTRTLYDWFAGSAGRQPHAPALEVGGASLTYGELRDRVTDMAGRVVEAHGEPPARVALLATRSVLAFVGYLATLRLGATVVPLNPGHPVRRNRAMCDLAGVDVVLADESGAAQLDAGLRDAAPVALTVSDGEALRSGCHGEPPARAVTPDDVAYILFTSGSTGRPKGVPIRHRNLSPYVAHNIERYVVGPGCRMSNTFDLTFDPSVFDLFVTWGGGGTLVVPQRSDLLTPGEYVARGRLTHWFSVPSVVSVAEELGSLTAGRVSTLRHSLFIGEQLTYRQALAWRAVAPGTTIDNVYGPTELTVACTDYRLPREPDRWPRTSNGTAPIGPVYDFLDFLVLDRSGRAAEEGELCVRGPQRFDGYLDAGDNRGRFLASEDGAVGELEGDGPVTAAHYYRTGDRVRFERGTLVHLGRLDDQVKVRGHRVELGEIEAAVRQHPAVSQAVVIATVGEADCELGGCYSGTAVPSGDLARWLRQRLPLHMVPRRFHHIDAMPLNANGKVDRGRLRELLAGAAMPTGPSRRDPGEPQGGG